MTTHQTTPRLFEIDLFHAVVTNVSTGEVTELARYFLPDEATGLMATILEPYALPVQGLFDSVSVQHLAMDASFAWLIVATDGCYDIAEELIAARECIADINCLTYLDWKGPDGRGIVPPVSLFCVRSREVLDAAAEKSPFLADVRRLVGGADDDLRWLLIYRPGGAMLASKHGASDRPVH